MDFLQFSTTPHSVVKHPNKAIKYQHNSPSKIKTNSISAVTTNFRKEKRHREGRKINIRQFTELKTIKNELPQQEIK